jgi:hypothetical protein
MQKNLPDGPGESVMMITHTGLVTIVVRSAFNVSWTARNLADCLERWNSCHRLSVTWLNHTSFALLSSRNLKSWSWTQS